MRMQYNFKYKSYVYHIQQHKNAECSKINCKIVPLAELCGQVCDMYVKIYYLNFLWILKNTLNLKVCGQQSIMSLCDYYAKMYLVQNFNRLNINRNYLSGGYSPGFNSPISRTSWGNKNRGNINRGNYVKSHFVIVLVD